MTSTAGRGPEVQEPSRAVDVEDSQHERIPPRVKCGRRDPAMLARPRQNQAVGQGRVDAGDFDQTGDHGEHQRQNGPELGQPSRQVGEPRDVAGTQHVQRQRRDVDPLTSLKCLRCDPSGQHMFATPPIAAMFDPPRARARGAVRGEADQVSVHRGGVAAERHGAGRRQFLRGAQVWVELLGGTAVERQFPMGVCGLREVIAHASAQAQSYEAGPHPRLCQASAFDQQIGLTRGWKASVVPIRPASSATASSRRLSRTAPSPENPLLSSGDTTRTNRAPGSRNSHALLLGPLAVVTGGGVEPQAGGVAE